MIPDSIDPDQLRTIVIVVIVALLVVIYVVMRFVQKLALKATMLIVLAGLGAALWVQRSDLSDCAETCECSLFGMDVEIPADELPDRC